MQCVSHSKQSPAENETHRAHQLTAGSPIRYGEAERWKLTKQKTGTTQPDRLPRALRTRNNRSKGAPKALSKDDWRGPDTRKELVTSNKKSILKADRAVNIFLQEGKEGGSTTTIIATNPDTRLPGLRWNDNSCWLDTSLEFLYYGLVYSGALEHLNTSVVLDPNQPLFTLAALLHERYSLPIESLTFSNTIFSSKERFRRGLLDVAAQSGMVGPAKDGKRYHLDGMSSLWVSSSCYATKSPQLLTIM
jgi:hypothetical protein